MKKKINIIRSFLILSLYIIYSCQKEKSELPVLTTVQVTEVYYTTAVSGGNVTSEGGDHITSRGICWYTSSNPTTSNNLTSDNGNLGAFTSNLIQLTPNTTYYVRAYAINTGGTSYGNQVTFTTMQTGVAVLTTTGVTLITQTTASSGANITDDNGEPVTSRGVCWSTLENPTITDGKTSDGTGIGTFPSLLTGLTGNTTYYLRAYATNNAGTAYGEQFSFKTGPVMATITTSEVSSISPTSVQAGGNLMSDGGTPVTARGICWNTSENPTLANNNSSYESGMGAFEISITELTPGTTYYIRAFAMNSIGIQYGNQVSFTTDPPDPLNVVDVEGNSYNVVRIGTQLWMKENLKTTKYSNGDLIPTTTPSTQSISGEIDAKYQWAFDGDEANVPIYGRLYTWFAVTDSRNICPSGWHAPGDNEWTTLTEYLINNGFGYGGSGVDIGKSMATTTGWLSDPYTGNIGNDPLINNNSGFSALPGGYRYDDGTFDHKGYTGYWWSSTNSDTYRAWKINMDSFLPNVYRTEYNKISAFSVRCLKN